MAAGANSDQDFILYCQKQIQSTTEEDKKWLHYIGRLRRLRVKVKDLVFTGIGRTVNELSRLEGKVGQEALDLVKQWNAILEAKEMEKSFSGYKKCPCPCACAKAKSSPENNGQGRAQAYPPQLMEINGLKNITKIPSRSITKRKSISAASSTSNIVMPETGVYQKVGPGLKQYICIVEGCRNKFNNANGKRNIFVFKNRKRFLNNHFRKYHLNLAINHLRPPVL